MPRLAIPVFFFAVAPAVAQPLFDSPWRAFATGDPDGGHYPVALAAGDFDGDGLADAVVGQNYFAPGLRVLRNLGGAEGRPALFEADGGVFYPLARGAWEIAVADLDGDGDLDLAANDTDYNDIGETLATLRNQGDGTFGPVVSFPAGGPTNGVAAADLDGDGDVELVAVHLAGGSTIAVLVNDGGGAFGPPVTHEVGPGPSRVAAGDLDGDGDTDLVVARTGNAVSVLFNDGVGGFGPAVRYDDLFDGPPGPADVALLDADADGDLDAVYSGGSLFDHARNQGVAILLRNAGGGTLDPEVFDLGLFVDPLFELSAADLDGDGRGDLLGSSPFASGYAVVRDDELGGFGPAALYAAVARSGEDAGVAATAAADLDGDGDPDVLTVGRIRRLLSAHENLGDGSFPELPLHGRGILHQVIDVGDVDGDGDLDAVTSHGGAASSDVLVLLNAGDGSFAEGHRASGDGYGFAKLRDLDGDGALDLLFVAGPNDGPPDFFTARGQGDGGFGPEVRWPLGACGLAHPGAFDLDGDGDLDVVNTETAACINVPESGKRLFISLNLGNGTFQPPYTVQAGAAPYNLAAGDFDEDGALDLATSSQHISALLFGNGDGTFEPEQPLPTGTVGANLLALDLDGDGHLDLATLDVYSPPGGGAGNESMLSVLLGDGDGGFAETEYDQHLTQEFRDWVTAGDVDADGDPDLVAGGVQDALVFLNDGLGAFGFAGRYGIGADAWAPHLADVTDDGVGDLVTLVTHESPPAGTEQGLAVMPGRAVATLVFADDFESGDTGAWN